MAENSLKIHIQAIVSGAKDLLGLNKAVDDLGKESAETAKQASNLSTALDESGEASGRSAAAFAKTAALIAGIGLAITKTISAAKEWIAAANIQERAERKLALSLKSLVNATDEQIQLLKDQAAALQELTGYGDEQTISAQAMLATFQLTAEEIQQLTPRLLDMAEASRKAGQEQVDLEQIAIALGKSFTGGLGSLKRYGVALTKAQEESFKLADQTGKVKILIEALDGNFAGLAAEIGGTYEGAIRKATDAHGDLQEVIGNQITQNADVINTTNAIKDAYKEMEEGVIGSSKEITSAVSAMARAVKGALGAIQIAWNALQISVKTTVLAINEGLNLINKGLAKITFGDVSAQWQQAVGELQQANAEMRASIAEDIDDLSNGYGKVSDAISGVIRDTRTLDQVTKEATDSAKTFADGWGLVRGAFDWIPGGVRKIYDLTAALAGVATAEEKTAESAKKLAELEKIAQKESAQLTDNLSKVTDSLSKNHDAMLLAAKLYREGAISLEQYSGATAKLVEKNARLRQEQRALNEAVEKALNATKKADDATKEATESLSGFVNLTAVVRNRYAELSDAAAAFFDKTMRGVNSIESWWAALSDRRFEQVKRDYDRLVKSNDALIERLRDGTASAKDMAAAQSKLAFNTNAVTHGMLALGETELAPLRAALEDAQRRMESLRDAAESTLTSLQNELDRMNGNLVAIENRDYGQKRLELQEKLAAAQAAGDAAAIAALKKSLALLQKIHQIKLKNLAADQESASTGSGVSLSSPHSRQASSGASSAPVKLEAQSETVINLDGKQIAKVVQPYFSEFGRLSG